MLAQHFFKVHRLDINLTNPSAKNNNGRIKQYNYYPNPSNPKTTRHTLAYMYSHKHTSTTPYAPFEDIASQNLTTASTLPVFKVSKPHLHDPIHSLATLATITTKAPQNENLSTRHCYIPTQIKSQPASQPACTPTSPYNLLK